jgi:hypothetical protein
VAEVFPPEVREALVRAANTSTTFDPMARQKAIERVQDWARWKYPELFRREAE